MVGTIPGNVRPSDGQLNCICLQGECIDYDGPLTTMDHECMKTHIHRTGISFLLWHNELHCVNRVGLINSTA